MGCAGEGEAPWRDRFQRGLAASSSGRGVATHGKFKSRVYENKPVISIAGRQTIFSRRIAVDPLLNVL
jgi:hypothetical protein